MDPLSHLPGFAPLDLSRYLPTNRQLGFSAFARFNFEVPREFLCYLGIRDGPQDCLVVAWSETNLNQNRWMTTVRALETLVGHDHLPFFRVPAYEHGRQGFILCPNPGVAESIRARYIQLGQEKIYFDIVRSVEYMPYYEDVNQHLVACRRI